jgi:hypothetical protein
MMLVVSGCMGGAGTTETTTTVKEVLTEDNSPGTNAEVTTTVKVATTQRRIMTTTTQAGSGVTAAVKDLAAALSSGVGYKCTYSYENIRSEGWMKGQKYHFKSTFQNAIHHAVSDGVYMYSWQDGKNEGIMFNLEEMKSLSAESKDKGYTDMKEVAASASNVECIPLPVSESEFAKPSGVNFQDMGELLKQLKGMQAGDGQIDMEAIKAMAAQQGAAD